MTWTWNKAAPRTSITTVLMIPQCRCNLLSPSTGHTLLVHVLICSWLIWSLLFSSLDVSLLQTIFRGAKSLGIYSQLFREDLASLEGRISRNAIYHPLCFMFTVFILYMMYVDCVNSSVCILSLYCLSLAAPFHILTESMYLANKKYSDSDWLLTMIIIRPHVVTGLNFRLTPVSCYVCVRTPFCPCVNVCVQTRGIP